MNDQQIPPAQNIEQGFETKLDNLDLGEFAETPIKSETEIAAEKQERVKAGFKILSDLREKIIDLGTMTSSEADSFQLLDAAPQAETIARQFADVTQEIADQQDSPEEVASLKEEQAGLYLEYAYNTFALLKKKFTEKMSEIIRVAGEQILKQQKPDQKLIDQVKCMLGVATLMESFQANTDLLVPDLVLEFPQLKAHCDLLNANLLTYLGVENNLKQLSDQSSKELNRFVADLRESISYEKIDTLFSILIDQAKLEVGTSRDVDGSIGEPSSVKEFATSQASDELLQRVEEMGQDSGANATEPQLNNTD